MKTVTKEILSFEVPVPGVVETLAEAVVSCGNEERALNFLNNYVLFHSHFTKLRSKIIAKLVELTKIPLLTEKKGEKDVIIENDGDYIARLEAELGEGALTQYTEQIAAVSSGLPVDYSVAIRGAASNSMPAKKWLAYYDAMVEQGKLDAFIAKQGLDLAADADEDTVKRTVANKVKELVTKAELAARQQALVAIG